MMGVFHLLTLYCAVRAAQSARPARWQAGAIAACGLGMACKESMATAPIIVAAYDRTFLFGSWRQAFRARGLLYAGLAITWVELGLLIASGERTSVQLSGFTESWTYLLNQLRMISRYVGLAFWPQSLVFDYGVPVQVSLSDVRLAGLVVTCLAVATLAALWFRPRLGFLGVWFFVTLAPTSSAIPIATEVGAERRMYLPLAAVVVLVVAGTYAGAVAASRKKWTARQWTAAAATGLAVVAALLGLRTAGRNREYSSVLVLAQTTVERYPHGRSYFFLGSELLREGRRDEGLHYLERSAVDFPGARFAIGLTYLEQQRLDAGIEQLEEYLRLLPTHINVPHARDMLARAYLEQGKLDRAAHHYTERLKLAPIDFGPLERLGDIAVRQNKLPEAIARYQAFLLQTPGSTSAHNSLGAALATSGRMPEAVQSFQRAVELDPRNRDAWLNLARAQVETGEPARGVEAARRAVALAPGHAVSYEVLGTALGLSGDLDAAIAAFKSAIALDPTDARARDGLALAGRIKSQQSR